jgi:hypothetical protein
MCRSSRVRVFFRGELKKGAAIDLPAPLKVSEVLARKGQLLPANGFNVLSFVLFRLREIKKEVAPVSGLVAIVQQAC